MTPVAQLIPSQLFSMCGGHLKGSCCRETQETPSRPFTTTVGRWCPWQATKSEWKPKSLHTPVSLFLKWTRECGSRLNLGQWVGLSKQFIMTVAESLPYKALERSPPPTTHLKLENLCTSYCWNHAWTPPVTRSSLFYWQLIPSSDSSESKICSFQLQTYDPSTLNGVNQLKR